MSTSLPIKKTETLFQEIDLLQKKVDEVSTQNHALKKQLDWFKQQLFGQKSERRLVEVPIEQGRLFDKSHATDPVDIPTEKISYTRKKTKKHRNDAVTDIGLRFDDTVPVEEICIDVPELHGENAEHYIVIDEHITYRLAQRPSSYVVLKYIQPVIKHKGTSVITTKTAPTPVFEKSLADVSFITGLLVDKFVYHLPLYRQHQKLQLSGITLSRSTLTNYVHRAALLLRPIYDALLRSILQSKVLALDETPVKAGQKKKGTMQQAWYWPLLGDQNEIAFHFSPSRARKVKVNCGAREGALGRVDDLLAGFNGTLVTDGYPVYRAYAKDNQHIVHAQCWMHARRYFIKAENDEPELVATALTFIRTLYRHDNVIKDKKLISDACQAYRTTHCKPVTELFFEWCQQQASRVDILPQSLFAKAIYYARHHETELKVYLTDPTVPMDTGALERGLRVIPMGKKNWLFNWTEVGAEHMGIIQSLMVSCKMQGINPSVYLTDVLQRVGMHPASKVDELTPKNWKKKYANHFLKSDLDRVGQ